LKPEEIQIYIMQVYLMKKLNLNLPWKQWVFTACNVTSGQPDYYLKTGTAIHLLLVNIDEYHPSLIHPFH
jgi:hypothetical protein